MKHAITLVSMMLAFGSANAQLWCPAGATWNYNITGVAADGCQTRTYSGDQIIGGRTAQRIDIATTVMNYLTNQIETSQGVFYTNEEDSVIYCWVNSAGVWAWDTLYCFNALPGDRWYPPGVDATCGLWGMLQATDTGHVVISGQSLRTVNVTYLDQYGQPSSGAFTITQRLGSGQMLIYPGGCIASEGPESLRLYSDDTFPQYDSGVASLCDLFNSVSETAAHSVMEIYPNPATDRITITSNGEQVRAFGMIDLLGQQVLYNSCTSSATVNVSALAPGTYTLRLFDAHAVPLSEARFVKE